MCTSPLLIRNKSPYYHRYVSFGNYEVPCGCCEECRYVMRSEWEVRLMFELAYFHRIGGTAVFLTFTYNDKCLPTLDVELGNDVVTLPCFNGYDILEFLDKLNSKMQWIYGKHSYKYFVCSEYGKNTRRPHYHACFFLASNVPYDCFTEMCRSLWHHGFMFPKYDKRKRKYVDNFGGLASPLLKGFDPNSGVNLCAGAKYLSKYITKDLSYFELNPAIPTSDKDWMREHKLLLPRHWQSKGLGFSIFKEYDVNNFDVVRTLLERGVVNPLNPSEGRVPLPQYVVNKLLYRSVPSERFSDTNGKRLYDRILTSFGEAYLPLQYKHKIDRVAQKMSELFQQTSEFEIDTYTRFLNLCKRLNITDITDNTQFYSCAIYHVLYKHMSPAFYKRFLDMHQRYIDVFSMKDSFFVWSSAKDCHTSKEYCESGISDKYSSVYDYRYHSDFAIVSQVDDLFCVTSRRIAELRGKDYLSKSEEESRYRYKYNYMYDKQLC